jgi:molybdate transport system ATP-binding protein
MNALDIDLELRAGDLAIRVALSIDARGLVLVGPNGAGKTSLLLGVLGVIEPSAGRLAVGGEVLFDRAANLAALPEDRRIAYVPQGYGLFPHLSAARNVELALECLEPPPPRDERRRRARALLDRLGCAHAADRRPAHLSGGERQRLALARAFAMTPRALLLDEPLAALDVEGRGDVRRLLRDELARLGRPFVIVTHDRDDAAAFDAPVAVMEEGRVVQRGTLAELARAPATAYVRSFAGA